jgi:hypothetical protein
MSYSSLPLLKPPTAAEKRLAALPPTLHGRNAQGRAYNADGTLRKKPKKEGSARKTKTAGPKSKAAKLAVPGVKYAQVVEYKFPKQGDKAVAYIQAALKELVVDPKRHTKPNFPIKGALKGVGLSTRKTGYQSYFSKYTKKYGHAPPEGAWATYQASKNKVI